MTAATQTGASAATTKQWEDKLNEEYYKKWVVFWKEGIRKKIGKKFFNVKQFVRMDEEDFGSQWQKYVCETVGVNEEFQERFWEDQGKKVARATINRRRQNTTTVMKKRFQGKELAMHEMNDRRLC